MSKEELYALIEELNDNTPCSNSDDSISWNAHRKAEKISDPTTRFIEREHIQFVCMKGAS